jgi:CheY-like chemotaxis protein
MVSGIRPRALTVLFVDGHPDTRWAYIEAARAEGIDAEAASDGWEAFAKAIRSAPDVVVTAVRLAGIDGLELTRCLRANEATRHVPVIVVTGLLGADLQAQAQAAGCAAFLTKPCDFDVIERTIRRIVVERERPVLQQA